MTSTRHLVLVAGLLGLGGIAAGLLTHGGCLTVPRSERAALTKGRAAVHGELERLEGTVPAGRPGHDGLWRAYLQVFEKEREQGHRDVANWCLARRLWRRPREPKLGEPDRRRRRLHGDRPRSGQWRRRGNERNLLAWSLLPPATRPGWWKWAIAGAPMLLVLTVGALGTILLTYRPAHDRPIDRDAVQRLRRNAGPRTPHARVASAAAVMVLIGLVAAP